MDFLEIEHGSAQYSRALELRSKVLREPLGLEYTEEQIGLEATQRHFVAECGGEYLAAASLLEEETGIARVRQVAVRGDLQGQGVGRKLMEFVEEQARIAGFEQVVLCSRHYAIPFYEKLGYVVVSDWFEEVGMPHRSMLKSL